MSASLVPNRRLRGNLNVPARVGRAGTGPIILLCLCLAGAGGATWWWTSTNQDDVDVDAILHAVARDDFVLDITERGEVLSAGLEEIRSLVKTKNTPGVAILRIVPEGTVVSKDDFLIELDSSALDAERTTQQIACNTVQALVIESRNLYETAIIAKREFLEGTYVEQRQTIESEVFVAEENLNRAKEYYEYSKKLAVKGYVNELQLEADKFAVEKSEKELEAARTKLKVLDEFTKPKTLKELESNIATSKAKWEADKKSFALELEKLSEIEDQIDKCTIVAPQDGTVIYAHERDRRGQGDFIVEEGAVVRERQVIMKMPDPDSMRVEININESLIQFVKPGMSAKIAPVGMGDMVLKGTVEKVNQYAEPTGWRKANVKEYKAFVSVDYPPPGLRAGLTASVTIQCSFVADALQVPVQSVYAHGDKLYCMVYDNSEWQARAVQCGPTNDKFFVIENGLEEGNRVALNPRRFLREVTLPELPPEQQQRAVPQRQSDTEDVASTSQPSEGDSGGESSSDAG